MKRHATVLSLFVLALLLGPITAQADKPLEPLKGKWVAQTFNGKPPPNGMTLTMTFLDDKVVGIEVIAGDEVERTEVKYKATAEGSLILYYDEENDPEGTKATWEVKADKKLYINNDDGDKLIFARPA